MRAKTDVFAPILPGDQAIEFRGSICTASGRNRWKSLQKLVTKSALLWHYKRTFTLAHARTTTRCLAVHICYLSLRPNTIRSSPSLTTNMPSLASSRRHIDAQDEWFNLFLSTTSMPALASTAPGMPAHQVWYRLAMKYVYSAALTRYF